MNKGNKMNAKVNNKECNCRGLCDRWSCSASRNDYFSVESKRISKGYTLKFTSAKESKLQSVKSRHTFIAP
jgi:hypothetical protein